MGQRRSGRVAAVRGLKADLLAWAAAYDATLNHDDPARSGFQDDTRRGRFAADGERFGGRLREELGSGFTVALQI